MKKQLKLVAFTVLMLVAGIANAQQTSGTITQKTNDKGNNISGADRVVRLIDNKGTIKYLQVSNGITTLTNRTPGGVLTTWQLGGTLSTDTTISFGTGTTSPTFTLDGEAFALNNIGTVSTTAADGSAVTQTFGSTASSTAAGVQGWTFLVRDEQTGKVRKLLATDALKVTAVQTEFAIATTESSTTNVAGAVGVASGNVLSSTIANPTQSDTATSGIPLDFVTNYNKVNVFRNGAKLRANTDYVLTNYSGYSRVHLVEDKTNPNTNMNYWELYNDDIIEIHYTK